MVNYQNDKIIRKCYSKNYTKTTKLLLEQSDLIGLIGDKTKRIGIKPNLVSPTPAEFGATTHPEVVEGIIQYLQEHKCENIVMIEGSWIGDKTSESYEMCGYRRLTEQYGVPFIDTQKETFHEVECDGMQLNICDAVFDIDFMINVPVLKGHGQTKITCALKNMKGLIPNTEKRHFHTMGLHKPIAHLSRGIHQDFIVVDHICGDLDFEDGGNPVQRDCIMTATDPVLLDSYVCKLLGYSVEQVPYVKLAESLGSGSCDLKNAKVIVYDECKNIRGEFTGEESDPWEGKLRPEDKILEIAYAIDDADACSACYASLAPALYRLKQEGLLDGLNYKIAIGQGHKGKTGELGIGNCCSSFEKNIKGCPPDEELVYKQLRELILADK